MPRAGSRSTAGPFGGAQSLRRGLSVLRALASAQDQGARLADIAEQCALTRATAHRLVQVLMEEGLAERTPRSLRYVLGRDAALLGIARPSALSLRGVASPLLRDICERTGDSTVLTVRSGLDTVCVERLLGDHPVQVILVAVGTRLPMGAGVAGLVMMAFLPEEECEQLLAANAARLARRRVDTAILRQRVPEVRRQGYAFTEEGVNPGTHALALPVLDPDGRAVAAISINAMADRLPASRVRRLFPILQEQARALEQAMGPLGTARA